MRFNLERYAPTIADVHDTGIFARALHEAFRFDRQIFEVKARGFVRAMLRPHHGKNTKFGEAWFASQQLFDAVVFVRREVVLFQEFRRDVHFDFWSLVFGLWSLINLLATKIKVLSPKPQNYFDLSFSLRATVIE